MTTTTLPGGLAPLKITCTSSNCAADLHCFKTTIEAGESEQDGGLAGRVEPS